MIKTSFAFLLALSFSLGAYCARDNVLGFHDNSKGSPLIALLDSARKSIDIEIYEMEDAKVLDAIHNALDRDVLVQIVQEPAPMGQRCKLFSPARSTDNEKCAEGKKLIAEVNAKGGSYKPFNKELCGVHGHSCFQHGKMVIIDSKTALISTGNFNSTNLCDLDQNPEVCNRDYSFVTTDSEVTSTLKEIFENDLSGSEYDLSSLLPTGVSDKLTVSPISLPRIIDFIGSAKNSIQLQNQYLHEPTIDEALIKAANSGVKVEVTVSSMCNFEKPKGHARDKATEIFSAFDEAGISSRFFTKHVMIRGKPGYLHAKAIIIDGTRAWVGSMNGSTESATMNREYGIFFDKAAWVNELSHIMNADHQDEGTETWQESLDCKKDHR